MWARRTRCLWVENFLQGRSVHIRTYAHAYSWNLENIYFIIKSGWLINLSHYILVSLPVWRVDISPFACNILDSVTVVPFPCKHYTLEIIAFSFVFIYWNVFPKTQEMAFLSPQIWNIFWGPCTVVSLYFIGFTYRERKSFTLQPI